MVVLLITAASVLNLARPFLVRGVIDDALPHGDTRLLLLLTAAVVGVAALTAVLGVVQTGLATAMGQQVMHGLRVDLFTRLQAQSLGFFTRTRGGEVQSRLTHDIAGMQSVVTTSATGVASNLTTTVATAVAMVALVVLPSAVWPARRSSRASSGSSPRRPASSTPRCARTCCWPSRTPPRPSCGGPSAPRASPTPWPGCRTGWTPWSAPGATAHRLSTVENADQVVVLEAGRVVERGAPARLRAAGGPYARLAARPVGSGDPGELPGWPAPQALRS